MAAPALPLALFGLLLPLAVYRRVRSSIGRQALSPRRLKLRATVVLAVLVLLGAPALADGRLEAAAGLAAGALIGALVGILALRHTRFETVGGAEYYVPHLVLGLALTSLLLARMGYRLYQLYPVLQAGGTPPPLAAMSPLTLGLVGLVLAYNAAFSLGLLRHLAGRPR